MSTLLSCGNYSPQLHTAHSDNSGTYYSQLQAAHSDKAEKRTSVLFLPDDIFRIHILKYIYWWLMITYTNSKSCKNIKSGSSKQYESQIPAVRIVAGIPGTGKVELFTSWCFSALGVTELAGCLTYCRLLSGCLCSPVKYSLYWVLLSLSCVFYISRLLSFSPFCLLSFIFCPLSVRFGLLS